MSSIETYYDSESKPTERDDKRKRHRNAKGITKDRQECVIF